MIKVLHILTDTNIGGAGRIFLQLLRCFDRERFDVVTALPSGAELIPFVRELGYRVIETEKSHDRSYERGAIAEYRRIIREEKPDIIHTHSAFSGKAAGFLSHVPVRIYTRHCVFDMPKKLTTFPGKQINGFVNNTLSTAIVAVAQAAADNLTETGVSEKKITVILNGVSPVPMISADEKKAFRASLGIAEDDFVCMISARLEPYKGHSYLLDAASLLAKGSLARRVVFLCLGDGTEREALTKRAAEEGLSDSVRFTGFVRDIVPYYNIADLSLNCSWGTEATSLALVEAMSLGKPAVVTDFGGNPGVIHDEENGLLIPKKDAAALRDAIVRVMEDPALYKTLSDGAARIYQTDFTPEVMTKKLETLYEAEYAKRVLKAHNTPADHREN